MVLTSSAFIDGLTNVLPPATVPVTLDYNTHTLAVPFVWNGTDNLIIQTSYSNGNTAISTTRSVQSTYSAAGFVSANYYRANSQTPAGILAAATPSGSSANRPNMILGYGLATSLAWAPITDLFSDAASTIPYAGESTAVVYAKPNSTTTYTATSTVIISSCSSAGNVTVTVGSPLSLTAIVTNASCPASGNGGIDLSVSGGVPPYIYLWSNTSIYQDIIELNPGTYSVTVTDANNITQTGSWTVDVNDPVCDYTFTTGTVSGIACYDAHITITVAGTSSLTVTAPFGNATFIAGQKILFKNGTTVHSGAYMHGYISNIFCSPADLPAVAASVEEEQPASLSLTSFTLYPNPTNGNFTLVQKGEQAYGSVKVEVFNMNGSKVMTSRMIGEKQHEFATASFPAGIYFVKIVAEGQVETIKLIKTR